MMKSHGRLREIVSTTIANRADARYQFDEQTVDQVLGELERCDPRSDNEVIDCMEKIVISIEHDRHLPDSDTG